MKISTQLMSPAMVNVHIPFPQNNQKRQYHLTRRSENELIVGGFFLAGGAVALQYGMAWYKQFQAAQAAKPKPDPASEEKKEDKAEEAKVKAKEEVKKDTKQETKSAGEASASPFATWFARNFYDGGFEEKMSKREAALILGVRESASPERIKDAHRRILLVNHPDRGGSAFIAAKINEAKDLLLKGKQ